ncbi:Chitin binding domain [Trinorchestia longiramus]|nr:Chitin binding domain [Trinorchestia longiramus]
MTSRLSGVRAALLLLMWWTAWEAIAVDTSGPIVQCETEGQRIADRGSCTRFHICRLSDGVFVTDLLICPDDMVYDMVSSTCVESIGGYLQDPAGCTTFYGCHPTRERSEGFVRQHYSCSGDLRFHPLARKIIVKEESNHREFWVHARVDQVEGRCLLHQDRKEVINTDTCFVFMVRTEEVDLSLATNSRRDLLLLFMPHYYNPGTVDQFCSINEDWQASKVDMSGASWSTLRKQ